MASAKDGVHNDTQQRQWDIEHAESGIYNKAMIWERGEG